VQDESSTRSERLVPADILVNLWNGQTRRVDYRAGETLLEAMLRGGIAAPFSCTMGECATCMVRRIRGDVELLQNNVLSDQELAAGYTLACQGVPCSAECEISLER
jgi:3-ketosteroid 9alpha-monooxygenase subunit B